jgi:hypothetical protein
MKESKTSWNLWPITRPGCSISYLIFCEKWWLSGGKYFLFWLRIETKRFDVWGTRLFAKDAKRYGTLVFFTLADRPRARANASH